MMNDKERNEMTVGYAEMRIFNHGIDALMEKIEDYSYWMFDDAEEIGSSDISACVRAVLSDYYPGELVQASVQETALVRNYVHNCIRMNSERKAA
jgi:hypothetical protein